MIKVSDYVINFLVKKGIKDIFLVSGGASMHLLDSLGSSPDLKYYCNHHEQASAMSAEGYARITKNFGVCLVSSGPAQTNALTGLMCAWEDSIPVMFISGNCNSDHLKGDTELRQRGVHEVDILPMVKDVTKYSVRLSKATNIQFELEKLYYWMMEGRKGPVWIDIPVDIQGKLVDECSLDHFGKASIMKPPLDLTKFNTLYRLLRESSRPVILIGGGALEEIPSIIQWANARTIPIVCTKNAYGYISGNTMGYVGMIGINGGRQANLTVQNADLVLILGSRLSLPSIGYATDMFAKDAKKIMVDIDFNTIRHSFVHIDLAFCTSIHYFIANVLSGVHIEPKDTSWALKVYCEYTVDFPFRPVNKRFVDAYNFYDQLGNALPKDTVVVADQGAAFYAWSQSFFVEESVSFTNGGFSPMGYGLPAAIGACIANNKKPTVCVIGDGGLEMNIQELQTIVHYNLPIKIFVFSNNGYGSIRNTQDANFNGRYVGSDPSSGVSCVNVLGISEAYQMEAYTISNDNELDMLERTFELEGSVLIDVKLDPNQKIEPKVVATKNVDGSIKPGLLEDMTPLLDRDVLKKLMIVKPVED